MSAGPNTRPFSAGIAARLRPDLTVAPVPAESPAPATAPAPLALTRFDDLPPIGPADLIHTDPDVLRAEIIGIVERAITSRPRDLQTELGPSEIGHPCERWLGYRFADVPPAVPGSMPWRPAVGIAVHDAFSDWLRAANDPTTPFPRWIPDLQVEVGELYPGRPISGHLDLYDVATATIVDLKVPGNSQMRKHRPGARITDDMYRGQVHLYGRGAVRLGLPVNRVALLRLPAAGELPDHVWQCEPYDEDVALAALERAGRIALLAKAFGARTPSAMPTFNHYCNRCEFFRPGATDLTKACPGDPEAAVNRRTAPDDSDWIER